MSTKEESSQSIPNENNELIKQLEIALEHIRKRAEAARQSQKERDFSNEGLASRCSEASFDKHYNAGVVLLKKLRKYENTPKKSIKYLALRRTALSIIDFERGVGDWISTFDKDVFHELQLQLMMAHGPSSFQQQINSVRFPLIEYLLFVPREITAIVSRKEINGFSDKFFEYYLQGKVQLLPSKSNSLMRKEIQTVCVDPSRILKHSLPNCQKLSDNDKWNMLKLTTSSSKEAESLVSTITNSNWDNLEHMLIKTKDPESLAQMRHPIFLVRTGIRELVCFSKVWDKDQMEKFIKQCISGLSMTLEIKRFECPLCKEGNKWVFDMIFMSEAKANSAKKQLSDIGIRPSPMVLNCPKVEIIVDACDAEGLEKLFQVLNTIIKENIDLVSC